MLGLYYHLKCVQIAVNMDKMTKYGAYLGIQCMQVGNSQNVGFHVDEEDVSSNTQCLRNSKGWLHLYAKFAVFIPESIQLMEGEIWD